MAAKHLYHAPSECPVCGDTLITTRKGCLHCGTEIAGEFASCEFCNLNQTDLDLLKVFLASRGNLREVEKHLQVSYPTARARLDAVLARLGLDGDPQTSEATRAAGTSLPGNPPGSRAGTATRHRRIPDPSRTRSSPASRRAS
ncbi:DUF2089 domain-containing protein [Tessaracoccus sp. HDW20]|uniref:DUF2089 domain-containing protein n=1 Tax=Tessaracoccus coleopterorum TaxID=2714950 RepID=UPI0018D3762C|nr:DUF2089 domain-containing protein [Tessaracoccus coleopterorum]NHB84310.1 DUF2089 domain-containing protein [Tessaracoccus coleopterorum]